MGERDIFAERRQRESQTVTRLNTAEIMTEQDPFFGRTTDAVWEGCLREFEKSLFGIEEDVCAKHQPVLNSSTGQEDSN